MNSRGGRTGQRSDAQKNHRSRDNGRRSRVVAAGLVVVIALVAGTIALLGGRSHRSPAQAEALKDAPPQRRASASPGEVTQEQIDKGGVIRTFHLVGNSVKMKFVSISAGEFSMGSPAGEEGRQESEGPQHLVRITKTFWMGMYEVTQEQYQAIMGTNPSYFKGPDSPVENLTWDDAQEFCRRLSAELGQPARLPTEAEWEYACRAGTTTAYTAYCLPEASRLGDYAWYSDNSGTPAHPQGQPHPVGRAKPTGLAVRLILYDMLGNVSEWCSDWYGDYASSAQDDPQGPPTGKYRVVRGGNWSLGAESCRSAYRAFADPTETKIDIGFRVVLEAQ
jgi:formylglycine-generating enzyme required for sulfatase activity